MMDENYSCQYHLDKQSPGQGRGRGRVRYFPLHVKFAGQRLSLGAIKVWEQDSILISSEVNMALVEILSCMSELKICQWNES